MTSFHLRPALYGTVCLDGFERSPSANVEPSRVEQGVAIPNLDPVRAKRGSRDPLPDGAPSRAKESRCGKWSEPDSTRLVLDSTIHAKYFHTIQ